MSSSGSGNASGVRRGAVVLVDFDPTRRSEQAGERPAVVIQNDRGNRAAPTTIVAPLTTSYDLANLYPFQVELPADSTPVRYDSAAPLNQIRTVSIEHRIQATFGRLRANGPIMNDIDRAIALSLGLSTRSH